MNSFEAFKTAAKSIKESVATDTMQAARKTQEAAKEAFTSFNNDIQMISRDALKAAVFARDSIADSKFAEDAIAASKSAKIAANAVLVAGVGAAAVAIDQARQTYDTYQNRGSQVIAKHGPAAKAQFNHLTNSAKKSFFDTCSTLKSQWNELMINPEPSFSSEISPDADTPKNSNSAQNTTGAKTQNNSTAKSPKSKTTKIKPDAQTSALLKRAAACAKKNGYVVDGKAWNALIDMALQGMESSIEQVEAGRGALAVKAQNTPNNNSNKPSK